LQAQPTLPEINQFSNTFLKQIREKGKNTFCSPLGVSYVNAMLYAGAAGVTKSELETVMKFNGSSFDQFDAFSKQINEINTREQVVKPNADKHVIRVLRKINYSFFL
jgi:serine protease inhibitor